MYLGSPRCVHSPYSTNRARSQALRVGRLNAESSRLIAEQSTRQHLASVAICIRRCDLHLHEGRFDFTDYGVICFPAQSLAEGAPSRITSQLP